MAVKVIHLIQNCISNTLPNASLTERYIAYVRIYKITNLLSLLISNVVKVDNALALATCSTIKTMY